MRLTGKLPKLIPSIIGTAMVTVVSISPTAADSNIAAWLKVVGWENPPQSLVSSNAEHLVFYLGIFLIFMGIVELIFGQTKFVRAIHVWFSQHVWWRLKRAKPTSVAADTGQPAILKNFAQTASIEASLARLPALDNKIENFEIQINKLDGDTPVRLFGAMLHIYDTAITQIFASLNGWLGKPGTQTIEHRKPVMNCSRILDAAPREPDVEFDPAVNRSYLEQHRSNIADARRFLAEIEGNLRRELTRLAVERAALLQESK